ncbi:MAG: ABC transporter ATP-binding protein [Caldilineaceae bacterium]|nr:ABC transporter ATP-binding protein [Caldilineaceae bacterium]
MNPIQFWWRLARFQAGRYTLMYIFYTGYTLSLAFAGLILRAFFDHLANEPGALALSVVLIGQLGNTLLAMIGLAAANAMGFYRFQPAVRALLLDNLFTHLLARPGAQPFPSGEAYSVGGVLNTLRDDIEQFFDFQLSISDLFSFGLTAMVALTAMLQVSVPITVGVFAPLIGIVLIANRLSSQVEAYRTRSRTATAQVAGAIGEIMGAVQAIQVNHAEERILAHFRQLSAARRQAMVRDQLLTRVIQALADNTVVLGTALLLLLAAQAMQTGTFTVGDFALFIAYLWPITELLRNIGTLLASYQQTQVSIQRLQALMPAVSPTQLTAPKPIYLTGALPALPVVIKRNADHLDVLEVKGLWYQAPLVQAFQSPAIDHPKAAFRLHPFDLRLARGSLTVITGEIGAGKTTLLRVLLGLLPKAGGEMYWNGVRVEHPATFFTPPRVAYTPQKPRLFSATLRDNILLGTPATPAALQQAIDWALLAPDLATMDAGVETLIGPRGMRLSGGQVQRTAAARMFVRDAELLVFDDLSSALDLETEARLWAQLLDQPARPTCLVVSHRPTLLQRADQILLLTQGHVGNQGK